MSCPYPTPEESMEQGCGTYVPLPEVVAPPTTPSLPYRVVECGPDGGRFTTGDLCPGAPLEAPCDTCAAEFSEQVIETDVSLPPAVVTRPELAITGGGLDIAFGGALALLAGAVLVRAQRKFAR